MRIEITKNIGKKTYKFQIENADFNDAYREAAKVDMLPTECTNCGSEDVSLTFKKPQGYNYPGIKCNKCGANAQIQGKKDQSEDYMKPMEVYQNPDQAQSAPTAQPSAQPAAADDRVGGPAPWKEKK